MLAPHSRAVSNKWPSKYLLECNSGGGCIIHQLPQGRCKSAGRAQPGYAACSARSFLLLLMSSPAHVGSQNRPQLSTNPITQFLGKGEDIGIGFFELRAPELSSIVHINQFHMQQQLVIAPNHLSCGDSSDKQILPNRSRIEVFVPVVLNGAISRNPYFWCPRDGIDDPLDNSLVKELQFWIGGFASSKQHGHRLSFPA